MSEPKTVEEFAKLCADADMAIVRAEKAERERDDLQAAFDLVVETLRDTTEKLEAALGDSS